MNYIVEVNGDFLIVQAKGEKITIDDLSDIEIVCFLVCCDEVNAFMDMGTTRIISECKIEEVKKRLEKKGISTSSSNFMGVNKDKMNQMIRDDIKCGQLKIFDPSIVGIGYDDQHIERSIL